jgi:hypothetical protein
VTSIVNALNRLAKRGLAYVAHHGRVDGTKAGDRYPYWTWCDPVTETP